MSKVVLQFTFRPSDEAAYGFPADPQIFPLPEGAEVVRFATDGHGFFSVPKVCMWVLLDPEAPQRPRAFRIIATEAHVPEGAKLLGSCEFGSWAWFLFEVPLS